MWNTGSPISYAWNTTAIILTRLSSSFRPPLKRATEWFNSTDIGCAKLIVLHIKVIKWDCLWQWNLSLSYPHETHTSLTFKFITNPVSDCRLDKQRNAKAQKCFSGLISARNRIRSSEWSRELEIMESSSASWQTYWRRGRDPLPLLALSGQYIYPQYHSINTNVQCYRLTLLPNHGHHWYQ